MCFVPDRDGWLICCSILRRIWTCKLEWGLSSLFCSRDMGFQEKLEMEILLILKQRVEVEVLEQFSMAVRHFDIACTSFQTRKLT